VGEAKVTWHGGLSLIKKFRRLGRGLTANSSFPDRTVTRRGSEFEVDKWIISDFIVKHLIPIVGIHPYPLDELLLMTASVCRLRPTHIFEWGTHVGKSARIFFEVSRRFEIVTEIHSVDLPKESQHEEHPGEKRGVLVKQIPEVRLHQGDGLEESMKILGELRGDIKPLFFLDGDHAYGSVMRELGSIMTSAPDAAILVHDTFYQSAESGYNTGPYRAIEDALKSVPNHYARMSTTTGLPGMTLLYVL
jgi:cephalosporin hydroxylase